MRVEMYNLYSMDLSMRALPEPATVQHMYYHKLIPPLL